MTTSAAATRTSDAPARRDSAGRPAAVFSRVTVVAPKTRIDVALPTDVSVADLLPMVLDMARESTPDGGARHGGWCLAKLGEAAVDPARTLGSLGIVDGDMLQLRKRAENPPPPLFDDVVDAIAVADPDSYRPWTDATARTIGRLAGTAALLTGAVALLLAGPGIAPAIAGTVAAVAMIAVGAVIARVYSDTTTGVLIAAAGLPLGLVGGLYVVPGPVGAPNMLLACTLVLVLSAVSIMVIGTGITTFVAAGTAAVLGAITFLIATLVDHPAAGFGAGAAAVAIGGISLLPRLTIQLARLPLPQVPGSAEDLREDTGFPDYALIERRAGIAHEYMTGMIIGCGVVAAIGALVAASSRGWFGIVLGAVVALVLMMRARSYANGSQAVALLAAGMLTAAGMLIGWMVQASAFSLILWVFGSLVLLAGCALVLGVVFPTRRFSPVLRRSTEILEAILIAAVLPLALAVMELYQTFRQL